ncbi:MAG: molybdopterin cofactor-binding domain-containing protein [Acidimicrobiia bacterium]
MAETTSVLGGAVRRREDPALITGTGLYTDDLNPAGCLHVAFVRSPFAKARITSIDTAEAAAMPGVRAVYTGADVAHLGHLPAQVPVRTRPLLATDQVAFAGEPVAMVVAESRYQAQDAAEAVFVDYDPQDPVIDLKAALAGDVLAHDDMDSNVIISWAAPFGDEEAQAKVREEIAAAKDRDDTVTVSLEMVNQRLTPTAIEPRSVVAEYSPGYDRYTVHSSTQIPHAIAGSIGKVLGVPNSSVHLIAPEVGGGFGAKLCHYPDEILVPWAAKQLGAPVKFTETRRETAVSTIHGRGWVATATVTGTRDGKILGYELEGIADMGAYTQNFTAAIPFLGLFIGSGQYDVPTWWKVDCVLTNTVVTDAYRGAGRPEAEYYLERIVDAFAREIDVDPVDVRKANFFPKFDEPVVTPIGFAMDTGDYATNLDALVEAADYEGLKAERDRLRAEGRFVGIGVSSYVEVCGFGPSGLADLGFSWSEYNLPSSFNGSGLLRVGPDGKAVLSIGTGPSGQGHQTTWAQVVSAETGIPLDDIRVIHGDTQESPTGIGTFGSRSLAVDGAAAHQAAGKVRAKAAKIAAHLLEASDEDIRFADGGAHVAGSPDTSVTWAEIAKAAYQPHTLPEGMEGGLEAHAVFSPENATWPFGSHLAMVEVEPETGDVRLLKYIGMDDCGNVVNPMIVDGQLHGGIAQGAGQALFEDTIYDAEGNLLTTSFMDYLIPTAATMPFFELHRTVTPTNVNPLGVKGIGEAGTIGSAQTVVNAVVDALAPIGVKHIDMPLRPRRVWEAIQAAKGA